MRSILEVGSEQLQNFSYFLTKQITTEKDYLYIFEEKKIK